MVDATNLLLGLSTITVQLLLLLQALILQSSRFNKSVVAIIGIPISVIAMFVDTCQIGGYLKSQGIMLQLNDYPG